MENSSRKISGIEEGRAYVIGRFGHIFLGDPHVSRHHAEIRVYKGRIILRDLGSANGIYLFRKGSWKKFDKGFVDPDEKILIGSKLYTPDELLARLRLFAET
jgi:hypothetical protein